MKKVNKDEYINFLENKILEYESTKINEDNLKLNAILKYQEELVTNKIYDRETLLNENKKLWDENAKLSQTIVLNNAYIEYLTNSFWWKFSNPIRKIWRTISNKKVKKIDYQINSNIKIKDKVSVIILAYNNDYELTSLIKNIKSQKYVNDIEIIIVTRNVNNKKIINNNIKYINLNNNSLTSDEAYIKILPHINGKYISIIDQNKIVNTNDWLYKALLPIVNNEALATLFIDEKLDFIKNSCTYPDLKKRIIRIDDSNVIYLPINRDIIQNIPSSILGKSNIIVKKKISNYYLI